MPSQSTTTTLGRNPFFLVVTRTGRSNASAHNYKVVLPTNKYFLILSQMCTMSYKHSSYQETHSSDPNATQKDKKTNEEHFPWILFILQILTISAHLVVLMSTCIVPMFHSRASIRRFLICRVNLTIR